MWRLVDARVIPENINDHHGQFDSEYEGTMILRKV
jgi:hypothetical protein